MNRVVLPFLVVGPLLFVGIGGCGRPSTFDPTSKTVPRIARTHLGKTRAQWLEQVQHADPAERVHAAWGLGTLYGDNEAREDAITLLLQDPDASVRFAALIAAGRLPVRKPLAAGFVVAEIHSDRQGVQHQARRSAVAIGALAFPATRTLLKSASARVRFHAAWILRRLGEHSEPAVPTLVQMLTEDPSREVRRQVALALGAAGAEGAQALSTLLDTLHSLLAERGLRQVGRSGVPVLVRLLQGDHIEHADFAATVFAGRRDLAREAVVPLIAVLHQEGPIGGDAAVALVRVGADALPALQAARARARGAHERAIQDVISRIESASQNE